MNKLSRGSKLSKDEVLFLNEEAPALAYIAKGLVKFYILNPGGKERILFLGKEGQYVSGLSQKEEDCRIYLQAKEESRVFFFQDGQIENLLSKNEEERNLFFSLFQQIDFLMGEIRDLTFNYFPSRLAGLLVHLEEDLGEKGMCFSHQELADLLGVSRVTVTRALGVFAEQGLIEKRRKKIIIKDLDGLKLKARGGEDN